MISRSSHDTNAPPRELRTWWVERAPDNVVRLVAELGRPAWQVWRSPWAVIPFTPPEVVRLYQTLAKVLREIGLGPGAVPTKDEELADDVRRAFAVIRESWEQRQGGHKLAAAVTDEEVTRRLAELLLAKGWTKQ